MVFNINKKSERRKWKNEKLVKNIINQRKR